MASGIHKSFPVDWPAGAPLVLRFLIWPAAAWAAAAAAMDAWPGALSYLPPAAALLALGVVAAALALPSRLRPLAVGAEAAAAGCVVAGLGGAGSPWLLLFPWLLLDHGTRPGNAGVALIAVPAAYAAAMWWGGAWPQWQQLLLHGAVYAVAAVYAAYSGQALRKDGPEPRADENPDAGVIRLQERVLALFGSLAAHESGPAAAGGARPDGSRGARALARALHAVLSRRRTEEEVDVTFRHFDPGDLLEAACDDWAACARVRGLDLQGHVSFDGAVEAFGDIIRITRILDLLLLAGCFSITSGTLRLAARLSGEGDREPGIEFILEVAGEPDDEFIAWRVRTALEERVGELGGESRTDGSPVTGEWRARLPLELEGGQGADRGRLPEVACHLTGNSMLREVMAGYLEGEGAILVDDPRAARLILLARSPHDPETETLCQDLKQSHPRIPVLCQGSTTGNPASLMLEADGLVPVPFSRQAFISLVNQHLLAITRDSRRRHGRAEPHAAGTQIPESGNGDVLVAEDDAISARVITRFLESEGCTVRRVRDGTAALAVLREGRPALAFLDMHMPGLGGVEVARRLREWEREQGREPLPLVALTASAADEDRRACREAGMDNFLTKPVERRALREMLGRFKVRETEG